MSHLRSFFFFWFRFDSRLILKIFRILLRHISKSTATEASEVKHNLQLHYFINCTEMLRTSYIDVLSKRFKTMIVLISMLVMVMMTSLRRSLLLPSSPRLWALRLPCCTITNHPILLKVNLINLVVTEIRIR